MKNQKKHCPNMNHGKTNPPISFCPSCGESFAKKTSRGSSACDEEKHRTMRRDRNHFCYDCGKDLTK